MESSLYIEINNLNMARQDWQIIMALIIQKVSPLRQQSNLTLPILSVN